MTSKPSALPAGQVLPDAVARNAQSLVLIWDRAEDWAVPRIPPSQARVLSVLERNGTMNLTQLARATGAIASSASRLCDRLEAAGLIERETSAGSRREVTLRLSGEGQRRLDAFAATRRADIDEVLQRMTPVGQRSLLEGLQQFSEAVAEALDSSA